MNKLIPLFIFIMLLVLLPIRPSVLAREEHQHEQPAAIVSAKEKALVESSELSGPTETIGISANQIQGMIDLAEEFPAMAGYQFRARLITIEAGGVIAIHQHASRPAIVHILEGEIVEHRNGEAPISYGPGSVAFEKTGYIHWWENVSASPVKAFAVDIVTEE